MLASSAWVKKLYSSHQWLNRHCVFARSLCQAGLFYSYGQGAPCPPLLGSDIWSYHPHRCWPHCAYPCTRSQAFVPSSSFCHRGLTHHHLAPGPNTVFHKPTPTPSTILLRAKNLARARPRKQSSCPFRLFQNPDWGSRRLLRGLDEGDEGQGLFWMKRTKCAEWACPLSGARGRVTTPARLISNQGVTSPGPGKVGCRGRGAGSQWPRAHTGSISAGLSRRQARSGQEGMHTGADASPPP